MTLTLTPCRLSFAVCLLLALAHKPEHVAHIEIVRCPHPATYRRNFSAS